MHFSPHEFPDGRIPKRDRHEYLTGYRNHAFNMTYMESHLNKKSFEKTASYMFNPKAVNRIKSIVPHAKIIMLLRDPVERAYSHYKISKWRYTRTKIKTFEDCIELDIKLLKWAGVIPKDENNTLRSLTKEDLDHLDVAWIKYANLSKGLWARCGTIVGRGIYAAQLSLWWKVYNEDERRNQFLVMKSEDLRPNADGHVHLKNITEFIGVSDRSIESPREIHKTDDIGPMRNETKVRLRRLYLPFNDALDDFLGSSWHDPWLWHE